MPRLCEDVFRLDRIWLDFFAEMFDEGAKVVNSVSVIRAPDGLKQFPVRNGPAAL